MQNANKSPIITPFYSLCQEHCTANRNHSLYISSPAALIMVRQTVKIVCPDHLPPWEKYFPPIHKLVYPQATIVPRGLHCFCYVTVQPVVQYSIYIESGSYYMAKKPTVLGTIVVAKLVS